QALEAMTRKSDERNARTFEAIHDMLIKVVDRLGSLEQSGAQFAPAMPAATLPTFDLDEPVAPPAPHVGTRASATLSPAEAAAAAASHALGDAGQPQESGDGRRSMLSGLTRAFRKDREAGAVAGVE